MIVPMEELQETLVAEIRKLRRGLHIDQQTLAERVGVTRSSISNIEAGRQSISLVMFCKLALALNQDPSKLLKIIIDESHVTVSSDDIQDTHVLKLIQDTLSK